MTPFQPNFDLTPPADDLQNAVTFLLVHTDHEVMDVLHIDNWDCLFKEQLFWLHFNLSCDLWPTADDLQNAITNAVTSLLFDPSHFVPI